MTQYKTSGTVSVPISVGEFMDKITILEIKAERIADEIKQANVARELSALLKLAEASIDLKAEGLEIVVELRRINMLLWDVEDSIRECESKQDFGDRFVDLARAVYCYNDQRALLKKKLNRLTGSELIEEKSYTAYGVAPPSES